MSQQYSTDLSDIQWERVHPFVEKNFGRPAQVERRRIVNAILYIRANRLPMANAALRVSQLEHGSFVLLALAARRHVGKAA